MSLEDEKAHLEGTHAAFGDIEFTVDGMIAEGDEVAIRWTASAIHKGAVMASLRRERRLNRAIHFGV